jgi:uncharacterized LabA/DUF88 family protein
MTQEAITTTKVRVRVFVDYWNFQLTFNEKESILQKLPDVRTSIDFRKLGPWLAERACQTAGVGPAAYSYEGMAIYASYNPRSETDKKFHHWVKNWLNRQPGIDAHCRERKTKSLPRCSACHQTIDTCPHAGCGKAISSTVEKGVDTLIATDMIRLAWEGAYDIAVIASLDADLIPAVEFLKLKARKVIQAGFPPKGVDLATACWGSFDVFAGRAELLRKVE